MEQEVVSRILRDMQEIVDKCRYPQDRIRWQGAQHVVCGALQEYYDSVVPLQAALEGSERHVLHTRSIANLRGFEPEGVESYFAQAEREADALYS